MEERRTAAWVLGIIALLVICFTVILPKVQYYIQTNKTHTLAFKNCVVHLKYDIPASDIERVNQNKLALCLCESYQNVPDTATSNKIIKIYKEFDRSSETDSIIATSSRSVLDYLIENKTAVFDTKIGWDD